MDDGLDLAQYIGYLRKIYGVVAAWEERAAETAPAWMQAMLAPRQRAGLLRRDLVWFGVTIPEDERPILPEIGDLPSLLGAMYVMEGSSLGGQFIARHVEDKLHLNQGEGDAYFRGHGNDTGRMWKEFCDVLKMRVADKDADAVVSSAKAMFAAFGAWLRRE